MSAFIKVEILNPDCEVIINIDDISYIEGNNVRMRSLVGKFEKHVVKVKSRAVRQEVNFLDAEEFVLTEKSLKYLLSKITTI